MFPVGVFQNSLTKVVAIFRRLEVFPGVNLPVASRVDTAVAKLIWISKGSHKSRRDLRQLFRTSPAFDRDQLRQLADALNLAPLLAEVLAESDEIV